MTYARRAIAADMDAAVAMARAFHAESPVHSPFPFNEAKVRDLITAAMGNPAWLPLVAVDDDGICGIALIYALPTFFSDAIMGGDLAFYVQRNRRGSRAAIAMLKEIDAWCGRMGVAALDMGINTGINHDAALSFFTKCGFRQIGLIVRK